MTTVNAEPRLIPFPVEVPLPISHAIVDGRLHPVFWTPACLHVLWAIIAIGTGGIPQATALSAFYAQGINSLAFAAIMVTASLLAIAGVHDHRRYAWLLILPQQVLLLISAVSCGTAVLMGHFADGVARPTGFILADQALPVLVWAFHSLALGARVTHR